MRIRDRTKAALFAAIATAVAVGGCFSFGDLSGGTGSDAGDDSSATSQDGDTTGSDASPSSDGGLFASDGSCPSNGGPTPIRVGEGAASYCIDSTEVTNRHYEQFLTAIEAGAPVTQPPECSWNTQLRPATISGDVFKPVVDVDWCDAYAFCAWSGKRLCGQIGGGALPESSVGDPTASQWLAACVYVADGGTENYPYGPVFKPLYCNGEELSDGGGVVEVGSSKNCVGGYPGLDDMCGNVDEWIDSCNGTAGMSDCCLSVGGGCNDTENNCGLGAVAGPTCPVRSRADAHSDLGFRCCSN